MTEPSRADSDHDRADESRDISDVGLPHAGDDGAAAATAGDAEPDEAALDEVFPPEDR